MILGEKTFINFGAKVEAARKKKGLTQEELIEADVDKLGLDNDKTPTELCEYLAVDIKPNAITQKLNVNVNRLMDEHKIAYHYKRTHDGRRITLTYEGSVSKRDSCDSDCGVCETPTQLTQTDTQ